MRLRFTQKAEHQLVAISRFIAKDNPKAAVRVIRDIRAAALLLADFPESGRVGSVSSVKEWVVRGLPYILIYRVDAVTQTLAVIEIVHGARRRPS